MHKSIAPLILFTLCLALRPIFAQVPQIGDLAPDFTLEQLNGDLVSLSDFRGQVVFINFFGYS